MKNSSMKYLITAFLTIAYLSLSVAQKKDFTDHRPQYRKWLDSYIIDKIKYTKTNTIIYFRFVCDNTNSGGAIFYPPGGEYQWYLKGRTVKKNFNITAVKNVRRNGIMVKKNVVGTSFHSSPLGKTGHTVFSCEVHFPRLPSELKEADLIEGKGQEYNRRHFNCFNVKLKTWDDKDLGTEEDSEKKVNKFEKKYNITSTVKPKKDKVEPTKMPDKVVKGKKLEKAGDIACGELLVLDGIQFHDNSIKYKGMVAAHSTLSHLFDYLRANPKAVVTLHGHTDVFGNKEDNKELSKQRVQKIQRWLSRYGINPKRINYEAHGSERPLIPEGDISNRRVEAKFECHD